jgi:hypothetical protein
MKTNLNQHKPHNYPLYSIHSDFDSFILYNDGDIGKQISNLDNNVDKIEEDKTVMVEPVGYVLYSLHE